MRPAIKLYQNLKNKLLIIKKKLEFSMKLPTIYMNFLHITNCFHIVMNYSSKNTILTQ